MLVVFSFALDAIDSMYAGATEPPAKELVGEVDESEGSSGEELEDSNERVHPRQQHAYVMEGRDCIGSARVFHALSHELISIPQLDLDSPPPEVYVS